MLALSLGACGGGEEEAARSTDRTAGGDIDQYCETFLALESAQPDINFEAPPEEVSEGARRFAREDLRPLTDRLVASAPDAIKDELGAFDQAVGELERTGDFEVFETPDFKEVDEVVDEYTVENCGWNEMAVNAIDYAFEGVTPQLEAGVYSFEFSNDGTEHHEMVIHRKNDGVTESFDQLLALPQDEAEAKVTFLGYADALPQEEGAHAVAELEPGEYQLVCFLPVGSTPEAEKAAREAGTEVEGPPHFTRGMKTEFTVT
jgi:hypothetical protein